ncbi:hypothetical protein [Amycolatopsis vastitatis]|uniref:Uncharacterized protein n=1 Tax=Amycolatopsis vastitatis TaxID=1905142 RepID=A0A229SL82_9PSEU|nr:hypothetical protein [Amycolatopsis vastitatis]OXM59540.1 hypothetical protein CF165_47220 [Amycolatopsis vastitatis]
MNDPLTLAAVGALALTEGIKFLYTQAGEALKRWRERKGAKTTEPVATQLPAAAFEGRLTEPHLDLAVVARLEQELRDLRAAVADYAQDIDEVDPGEENLLAAVEGLRRAMEAVFGQRITFKGETRPASGTQVTGEAVVEEVFGYVAGLRANRLIAGTVTGRVSAKNVGPGGQVVGIDVDTVG